MLRCSGIVTGDAELLPGIVLSASAKALPGTVEATGGAPRTASWGLPGAACVCEFDLPCPVVVGAETVGVAPMASGWVLPDWGLCGAYSEFPSVARYCDPPEGCMDAAGLCNGIGRTSLFAGIVLELIWATSLGAMAEPVSWYPVDGSALCALELYPGLGGCVVVPSSGSSSITNSVCTRSCGTCPGCGARLPCPAIRLC
jgi:hypothetical protein